jgi:hypothetical protein
MIAWAIILITLVVVAVCLAHRDGYQLGREHGYQEGRDVGQSERQVRQEGRIHPHP